MRLVLNRREGSYGLNLGLINDFQEEFVPSFNYPESIDQQITIWIEDKLSTKSFDAIFIPLSLNEDYINFSGIRLGMHVRFSEILGDRRGVPIVFMGEETRDEICIISELGYFLFSAGVYLIKENKDAIKSISKERLKVVTHEYIKDILSKKIIIDPPDFYDSHHAIANEWSLILLDRLSGQNILRDKPELKEIQSNLYIKWLLAQKGVDLQVGLKSQNEKFTFSRVKGKRVLLVDDEWEKGWLDLFRAFFKHGDSDGAEVECLKIEKGDAPDQIIRKLDQALQEDWDLFLLDVRLADADFNQDADYHSFTGFKALRRIKESNFGNQVMLISASNKQWIYKHGLELGADEELLKPDIGDATNAQHLSILEEKIDFLFDRGCLKKIYSSVKEIKQYFSLAKFYKAVSDLNKSMLFMGLEMEVKKMVELSANILRQGGEESIEFATLSLFKNLESINSIFIQTDSKDSENLIFFDDNSEVLFYDFNKDEKRYESFRFNDIRNVSKKVAAFRSVENKFRAICFKKFMLDDPEIHRVIHKMAVYRNYFIHPGTKQLRPLTSRDFIEWFYVFEQVYKSYS